MALNRIAITSYLNTVPFIYGMANSCAKFSDVQFSSPNKCAEAYLNKQVDIALMPVEVITSLSDSRIITSYCIGARETVYSVILAGNQPISEITDIYLDTHSLTSVKLVQILCAELWHINPRWHRLEQLDQLDQAKEGDGFLLIGDKVFDYKTKFKYAYDLAESWHRLTGLPFVFAAWVAREGVSEDYVQQLEAAFKYGVQNIEKAIEHCGFTQKPYALDYLTQNIDFIFDNQKRKALTLFWEKGRQSYPPSQPG